MQAHPLGGWTTAEPHKWVDMSLSEGGSESGDEGETTTLETEIEHAKNRIDRLIDGRDGHDTPEFNLAIGDNEEADVSALEFVVRLAQAKAEDSCAAKGGEGVAAPLTVPKGKKGIEVKRAKGALVPSARMA